MFSKKSQVYLLFGAVFPFYVDDVVVVSERVEVYPVVVVVHRPIGPFLRGEYWLLGA